MAFTGLLVCGLDGVALASTIASSLTFRGASQKVLEPVSVR
jgi:hypothetical protein